MKVIKLDRICKVYNGFGERKVALHDISLKLSEGEFLIIRGSKGSGKSSLIYILGLLDDPTSGEYIFNNLEVLSYSEDKRAKFRGDNIGMIFNDFNLVTDLRISGNLELPLLYQGLNKRGRKKRIDVVADQFKLEKILRKYPEKLTRFECKKVALAKSIIAGQSLILADIPTAGLDSSEQEELIGLFKQIWGEGKRTIVFTTRDHLEVNFAKVLEIRDGTFRF